MTVLLLIFRFGLFLFLFLLWSPWPGLQRLCWIIMMRVDICVLFLTLEKLSSDFTMFSMSLLYYSLYYTKVGSLYGKLLLLLLFLSRNGCWILLKAFYDSTEMIIWILLFNLLIWCITLIDLHLFIFLHLWDKSYLIMVHDPFNALLDSVC